MKIHSNVIYTFEDFVKFTDPLKNGNEFIYRGQRKIYEEKGLLTKVGRQFKSNNRLIDIINNKTIESQYTIDQFIDDEKDLYKIYDLKTSHLQSFQINDKFLKLALAQHHGLCTRLLDWTINPLVALFFAVENNAQDSEPVIFRMKHNGFNKNLGNDPLIIDKVKVVLPFGVSNRIIAQQGVFTVHPEPWKYFNSDDLEIIRIDPKARKNIKKILFVYGFNRETLFPDLDGVASALNYWKFEIGYED